METRVVGMTMNSEEWRKETQRLAGAVAKYFKPKENLTIQDFIATAEGLLKEEESAQGKHPS